MSWLTVRKIKSFFTIVDGLKFELGARGVMQAAGVGRMRPNVLMLGYKNNWPVCSKEELQAYFNVMQ